MSWKKISAARVAADEPYTSYALDRAVRNLHAAAEGRLQAATCVWSHGSAGVDDTPSLAPLTVRSLPLDWRLSPEAGRLRIQLGYDVDNAAVKARWRCILPSEEVVVLEDWTSLAVSTGLALKTWTLDLAAVRARRGRELELRLDLWSDTAGATSATFTISDIDRGRIRVTTSPLATFGALDGCRVELRDGSGTALPTDEPLVQTTRMEASPNTIYVYPWFSPDQAARFNSGATDAPATVALTRYGTIKLYSLTVEELAASSVTPYPRTAEEVFPYHDPDAVAPAYSPGTVPTAAGLRFLYAAAEYLFRTRAPIHCWGPAGFQSSFIAANTRDSTRVHSWALVRDISATYDLWHGWVSEDEGAFVLDDGTTLTRVGLEVDLHLLIFANDDAPVSLDLLIHPKNNASANLTTFVFNDLIQIEGVEEASSYFRRAWLTQQEPIPAAQETTNLTGLLPPRYPRGRLWRQTIRLGTTSTSGRQYLSLRVRPSSSTPANHFASNGRVYYVCALGVTVRGATDPAWGEIGV